MRSLYCGCIWEKTHKMNSVDSALSVMAFTLPSPGVQLTGFLLLPPMEACMLSANAQIVEWDGAFLVSGGFLVAFFFFFFNPLLFACLLLVVRKFRCTSWRELLLQDYWILHLPQVRSAMRREKLVNVLWPQCLVFWAGRHQGTFLLPFSCVTDFQESSSPACLPASRHAVNIGVQPVLECTCVFLNVDPYLTFYLVWTG